MKQTIADQKVLERMAAGALCRDGFLGNDPRELSDIIAADTAAVEAAGLSHADVAAALSEAMARAAAGFGNLVPIRTHLAATYIEAMGRIPSPWPGEGVFRKGELQVADQASGRTIFATPLSIHLIAAHGFYQGRGSRYRLEPADAIALLDIAPDRK
ncbi:MAG: hypothetical protein ABFD92_17865 [Planctomycetaceae bacterium]|nr:hypothetical protein [Planctomycetaceae bacterium]